VQFNTNAVSSIAVDSIKCEIIHLSERKLQQTSVYYSISSRIFTDVTADKQHGWWNLISHRRMENAVKEKNVLMSNVHLRSK